MTEGEFFARITGSDSDLARAIAALEASGHPFCLIGGVAVNQYAEPVVTLDAAFAAAASTGVAEALRLQDFEVETFPCSMNARLPGRKLRLLITVNSRYAEFPGRAVPGKISDFPMPVASLEDVVREKFWALQDPERRASKRAKDRADSIRLAKTRPRVAAMIPPGLIPEVDDLCSRAMNSRVPPAIAWGRRFGFGKGVDLLNS